MSEIDLLKKIVQGINRLFWVYVIGVILSISIGIYLTNFQINRVQAMSGGQTSQALVDEFNNLLEHNKLEELKTLCLADIEEKPLGVVGHYYLGLAFFHERKNTESKMHLQRALKINPAWTSQIQPYLDQL